METVVKILKGAASVAVHSLGTLVIIGLLNRNSYGRAALGTDYTPQ